MSRTLPHPLVSPPLSEGAPEEDESVGSCIEETEDDISLYLPTTETEKNNTISSDSSSTVYFTSYPQSSTIKVPTFKSKMMKLSPIPLSVTPGSLRSRGSVLSLRSSVSSR